MRSSPRWFLALLTVILPATLVNAAAEVEVIRTACPDTPFAEFIRLIPATLLINQDGVFFVLEKQ